MSTKDDSTSTTRTRTEPKTRSPRVDEHGFPVTDPLPRSDEDEDTKRDKAPSAVPRMG